LGGETRDADDVGGGAMVMYDMNSLEGNNIASRSSSSS
jgi:hypothetical protein